MELAHQKCESCESGAAALSPEDARQLASQIPDWGVSDTKIERTFDFASFIEAMDFANDIARIAEQENHHPDLHVSWGKVRVELTTHKVGRLTRNDFIVAAKIDELSQE